jgi:cyclopropane fatty-acyl-phospholipid synthase-like methyltransferase
MKQQHTTETSYKYDGITIHAARGLHEYAMEVIRDNCNVNGHVLDLGCGSGAFTKRLQNHGFTTTSVDLTLDSFVLSSDSYELDFNNIDFAAQLAGKSYDGIVALEVIEHLENPIQFLRQIKLISNPNTVILVSFPNLNMYKSLITFFKEGTFGNFSPFLYWETGHQTVIPEWLFEEHLKKTGFTIEAKHYCAPVDFHLNLIKRQIHKFFFRLVCMFNKKIPPEARISEVTLFFIRNNVDRFEIKTPVKRE